MTWDFAECNPFSASTGNFSGAVEWVAKAICGFVPNAPGRVVQANAKSVSIPVSAVISMDPPYYSNISYADLSDYFYVWMKRAVGRLFPEQFVTITVPKAEELIADRYRHGGDESARQFFLNGMTTALGTIQKQEANTCPTAIYYAFKKSEVGKEEMTSSGWITFLQAVLEAPYQVIRTWPVRTERSARTVAIGNNALATAVVLVCRKRNGRADICTRAEFIRALKRELNISVETVAGLLPWREVVEPHKDVATGDFQQAEFAADLGKVHAGSAPSEYRDPQEFFSRTYLTDGLSNLLVGAAKRLSNGGGDPVVELQTNFGGGCESACKKDPGFGVIGVE